MNKYQVSNLELRSLDNTNVAQLLTSTVATLKTFSTDNPSETFYSQQLPLLEQALEPFEAGLHKSRASQVAKPLEAADKERDLAFTTVTKLVRAYSSVPTEPIASSYQLLAGLLKNYKLTSKTSYEEETTLLRNLLKELAKDTYSSAIGHLHLSDPIASLASAQSKFEAAYTERLAEQASASPSQAKQLRKTLLDSYSLIVDYTAINAMAHPEKTHLSRLRDDLNSIRKRYKQVTGEKKKAEQDS